MGSINSITIDTHTLLWYLDEDFKDGEILAKYGVHVVW